MAEVTVDDILARLKELDADEERLYQQQEEHKAKLTKLDADSRLLISSGNLPQADRDRLLEGTTEFLADTFRKVLKRNAKARQAAAAQAETKATTEQLGGVSAGGFPRLA